MDRGVPAASRVVLGVDPGSVRMGWAVVCAQGNTVRRVDSGTIRLDARQSVPERLGKLLVACERLFGAHAIDALAIEAAFVKDNPHTALVLGQARGLPIALAAARGIVVAEYPPASVKRAIVGSGRAQKSQIQAMVRLALDMAELAAEDEADALAVAITHCRQTQLASLLSVPPDAGQGAAPATSLATPLTPAQAIYLQAVAGAQLRRRTR